MNDNNAPAGQPSFQVFFRNVGTDTVMEASVPVTGNFSIVLHHARVCFGEFVALAVFDNNLIKRLYPNTRLELFDGCEVLVLSESTSWDSLRANAGPEISNRLYMELLPHEIGQNNCSPRPSPRGEAPSLLSSPTFLRNSGTLSPLTKSSPSLIVRRYFSMCCNCV
jgi:hypothetical protein